MSRTTVETEVRFVWLTNGKVELSGASGLYRDHRCDPTKTFSRSKHDFTGHAPSCELCQAGWSREAGIGSRLIAKSSQQFAGLGADCPRVASA